MLKKIQLGLWSMVFWTNEALAQSPGDSLSGAKGVNLTIDGLKNMITGLACRFINVALVLIVVAVVFYGIKFMISQGDPTKLGEAKKGLTWGIVGIAVILGTYTIIATVAYYIGAEVPKIALGC